MLPILPGTLLISDPFLKDPNFLRSVIFLCEHQEEGTVGFIINKLHDEPLENFITAKGSKHFPLQGNRDYRIEKILSEQRNSNADILI